MHALNVSSHIMQVILFRHLIGLNCRLYMVLDMILKISDVLIYPSILGNNLVCKIIQALTTIAKPGTYEEQAILWILMHKVCYRI